MDHPSALGFGFARIGLNLLIRNVGGPLHSTEDRRPRMDTEIPAFALSRIVDPKRWYSGPQKAIPLN